jgi:mannose-6-phosphate isomerase
LASDVVGPGTAFHLRAGTVHRMRALEDSLLLEVSTSQLDDVVRLEDRYGRAS